MSTTRITTEVTPLGKFSVCFEVDWLAHSICFTDPAPHGSLRLQVVLGQFSVTGDDKLDFTMTVDNTATLRIAQIQDDKGNPAQIDGLPAWSVSDTTIATLTPAADGMSAELVPVGPALPVQVSVTVDADLGAGVTPLNGFANADLTAGQAAVINITAEVH
jgi:hypothetical protein